MIETRKHSYIIYVIVVGLLLENLYFSTIPAIPDYICRKELKVFIFQMCCNIRSVFISTF
jgi:hypothetical protein